MTDRNRKKVETTEMDAIRRSTRISTRDRIQNGEIRRRVGLEDTLTNEIDRRQLICYGHVQKMDNYRLPKQVKSGHLLQRDNEVDQKILNGEHKEGHVRKRTY
ncbi:hypothetical protein HHI36_022432 [Cryptolaemus montrouzieri]|uniref:Uncharacterized protein n=1 Tax=Cryptolaemus montrouzieri TaxID=559131 RepID=A0ABD2MZS7_9CUCU